MDLTKHWEAFKEKETVWFLIVSAIVLISSMKIACETFPVDSEDSKIVSKEDAPKSIPKWVTENNLSWMVFFAGSIICVLAYIFSNKTGNNELGVGLLALTLTGMLIACIIFDQIIKLFQPKKEEFGSIEEEEVINYYDKIAPELDYTQKGAIIDKTKNLTISVNTGGKFLLLSKEQNPIQAILKGKGKGYTEDGSGPIEGKGTNGKLSIPANTLSEGVYYLHSYEDKPELLPQGQDGFKIGNTITYTNDGSGNYTSVGTTTEFKEDPFKLVIVSTNKLDVEMIKLLGGISIGVLVAMAVLYIMIGWKKFSETFTESNSIWGKFKILLTYASYAFPIGIQIAAFSAIIGFNKPDEESKETISAHEEYKTPIFWWAVGAYVVRLLQVSYLFYNVRKEYQS